MAQRSWIGLRKKERSSLNLSIRVSLYASSIHIWSPTTRQTGSQRTLLPRDQQDQLQQLAAIVQAQPAEALVLVAGDFNLPCGCWLYNEFLERSHLQDPLAGDARPTYRPFPGVPARYALPIDFVFVRPPSSLPVHIDVRFSFAEKMALVGGGRGYLSDHLALLATLRWDGVTTG